MKTLAIAIPVLLTALVLGPPQVRSAEPLVADISEDLIAITTGFEGSDLLLFGTTDGDGDVIVVVRGAAEEIVVRRKARIAGIWVNRDDVTFAAAPSFYHVASSGPIEDLLPPEALSEAQIGVEQLVLESTTALDREEAEAFRAALIRNQQRRGLYSSSVGEVSFTGGRLFRTKVSFPANVQTGPYAAEVYLVDDSEVVSMTVTPLRVSKLGFEAEMFSFAHRQSALYGLIAIAVALMAGWAAGFIFRKA